MVTEYSRWFQKGPHPGDIITLDRPGPSSWKILEKLSEYDYQVNIEENEESGRRSLASAKYLCSDPKSRTRKALMRIYTRVPHGKTEMHDAATRSQQVTTFEPPELIAYRDLTEKGSSETPRLLGYKTGKQDGSGLVPGGFIIWLVWEIVPGLRLGDGNGADAFWALESDERQRVRVALVIDLAKLYEIRWLPCILGARSLVWHQEKQKLYFIAPFSRVDRPRRDITFGADWMAHFDLVQPDPSMDESDPDWGKDTSNWVY
ncbi:Uncharacterized protein PECH_005708 [Penicillium ucsense]|uniref:Uncharacterized protein n=1 Tax=Penicillium ucsense TaxID=2839758 RepID=A0A8J8WFJ8_9EURO|nr:Uncharacterized protein PECM_001300 [Penicillium ucsense]KAF7736225.1 Uncharacterized protein PECH_005708 [Penicillium ucsense]